MSKRRNTPSVENIRNPWLRRPVLVVVAVSIIPILPILYVADVTRKVLFGPYELGEITVEYGDHLIDLFKKIKITWLYNVKQRESAEKAAKSRRAAKSKL